MSKGIYNPSFFKNHPEMARIEGCLYVVVLVNKVTSKRECVKIGITKGKDWRHAIKRSKGFTGYDIRIQKTVSGPLEDIYYLEEYLHELWADHRYYDSHVFGGHTELFSVDMLSAILESIPDKL